MTDKPEIRFLDVKEFDENTIRWMFDKNGKRIGVCQTLTMTSDEFKQRYPEAALKAENPPEDYPGQNYFHEHNPRVKQAEESFRKNLDIDA
jgi:hypothetical protein